MRRLDGFNSILRFRNNPGLGPRGLVSIALDSHEDLLVRRVTLENRSVSLLDKTGFVRLGESRRLYKGRV